MRGDCSSPVSDGVVETALGSVEGRVNLGIVIFDVGLETSAFKVSHSLDGRVGVSLVI